MNLNIDENEEEYQNFFIPNNDIETLEMKKYINNFDDFLKDYLNIFNQFSWNNDLYSKLLFHSLLSKIFDKIYVNIRANVIDNRINLLLIQTQGSGKGKGMIIIKKLINELNKSILSLKINSISDYTDAGLIGTIIEKKVKKESLNEVRLGIFAEENSDIIYMEEAKLVLASNKTRQESNIFQYINTGLNSIFSGENIINKDMRLGRVSCKVNACFILTTFPTKLADIEGLKSGFYRRILTYYNNLSILELKKNNEILTDSIISTENNADNFDIYTDSEIQALVFKFKNVIINYRNMIKNNKLRINIGNYVGAYIESKTSEYFIRYSKDLTDEEAKVLLSILTSYENYALIIASHRAIINNTTVIRREDIVYAFEIIDEVMHGLEKYIDYVYENNTDYREKYDKTLMLLIKDFLSVYLKEHEGITKSLLVNEIKTFLKNNNNPRSELPINRLLKVLLDEGFIKAVKNKKYINIYLNDK